MVAPAPGRGPAKLPVVYFGRSPLLTDRSLDRVLDRLRTAVEAIVDARDDRVYTMTPCRFAGRSGLYAKDLFERSAFRIRLNRMGFEFGEPWVRVTDTGFAGAGGPVLPDFVVTADEDGDDPGRVMVSPPGFLVFATLAHRVWAPVPDELRLLRAVLAGARPVGSGDPRALCRAIEDGLTR